MYMNRWHVNLCVHSKNWNMQLNWVRNREIVLCCIELSCTVPCSHSYHFLSHSVALFCMLSMLKIAQVVRLLADLFTCCFFVYAVNKNCAFISHTHIKWHELCDRLFAPHYVRDAWCTVWWWCWWCWTLSKHAIFYFISFRCGFIISFCWGFLFWKGQH